MITEALIQSPAILKRMDFEAAGTGWWAYGKVRSGKIVVLSDRNWTPIPEIIMFARDMVGALNKHLHHDGAWLVGFTHPKPIVFIGDRGGTDFDRFVFLFIDRDGDPQFTIECDDGIIAALTVGPDHWMEEAERGWQKWFHHMRRVITPRPEQTYKRAQGELAPSLTKH